MTTDDIRKGLRNIKTRSDTITQVSSAGTPMVDEVLPLLQDRNEAVRWCAIRILSEIGDNSAVGALITLLEQSKNASTATNALRSITGQEFGDNPDDWRDWASKDKEVRNEAGGAILSDQDLVTEATRDLPAEVTGSGLTYTVKVSLPDNRKQDVWIDLAQKDSDGRPIVQLCTPCGEADPTKYEYALKLNMSITFGAVSLALMENKLYFAMVDSYMRKTIHPQDVAESIMSLAKHGDSIEKTLSDEDKF